MKHVPPFLRIIFNGSSSIVPGRRVAVAVVVVVVVPEYDECNRALGDEILM